MMNSGSLGKTRRRAVRKVGFLVVLMLVTLVYAATPLTAFACNGNNNNNNNNGSGNGSGKQKGNGISASDNQAIADLKAGVNAGENLIDSQGNPVVKFADLKQGQRFKVKFSDGVSLNAEFVGNGKAVVILPSGKQVIDQLQPDGTAIVTDINNNPAVVSVANSSKETFSMFQNSTPSSWQLFKLNGSLLDRNAIKKAGQKFEIERIGNSTLMQAVYLGNGNVGRNLVLVTIPHSKPVTLSLNEL
ncbi:MAG TPA: hypothetical protein VN207_08745 [Ktedonobacteraceae bacterium]|nr:hypothetical protein [Ktedonobacteraceae bacterium]